MPAAIQGYATAGYGGHALGHVISLAADMTIQMLCVAWILGNGIMVR